MNRYHIDPCRHADIAGTDTTDTEKTADMRYFWYDPSLDIMYYMAGDGPVSENSAF